MATDTTPRRATAEIAPLLAGYWAFGQFWGVWVVIFADFLRVHAMSEGQAGIMFAFLAIVSISVMILIAPRLQSLPLAVNLPLGLVSMGLGAVLTAYLPLELLWAGFIVLGAGNGLIDVFMNVAAQGIEARVHRPVLQLLHAFYNAGGITGALGAGIAHILGVPFRASLAATGIAMFAVAAWNATAAHARTDREALDATISLSAFRRSPMLIAPAFALLFAFLVEGSMDIWSVTYLRRTLGSSTMAAAAGFAAFAGAMMAGRLLAGRILFGLGYRRTILVAGLGSMAAGLVATLTNDPWIASAAFLFLGFFLAAAAPAAFGFVRETDEHPTHAIAAMTTVGYSGFVFGPPLMGWLASTYGLRATMGFIVAATLGVAVSSLPTHRTAVGRALGPSHSA